MNTLFNFSFYILVSAGGGLINENQARARQAQQVRAAKFNRQVGTHKFVFYNMTNSVEFEKRF